MVGPNLRGRPGCGRFSAADHPGTRFILGHEDRPRGCKAQIGRSSRGASSRMRRFHCLLLVLPHRKENRRQTATSRIWKVARVPGNNLLTGDLPTLGCAPLVGVVAQLVEHHNGIVGVAGSNPVGSTIQRPLRRNLPPLPQGAALWPDGATRENEVLNSSPASWPIACRPGPIPKPT